MNDLRREVADAVVVGAGPAGLMAAEVLSAQGVLVQVYDAMPSAGRKFLLAGRGGLNLTHAEPLDRFVSRLRPPAPPLLDQVRAFAPEALRAWAQALGVSTCVGSSLQVKARAVVLALGGASWSRLGSDGAWQPWLREAGVEVAALVPSNCGFDVAGGWTPHFASRFAGHPFKSVSIEVDGVPRKGEFVATATGVEGSLIYAASAELREQIAAQGEAVCRLDLLPDHSLERVQAEVTHPRGSRSLSSHLKSRLGLDGIKLGLLHELLTRDSLHDPVQLAQAIKSLPLRLSSTRPIDEAISSAGGVRWSALDPTGMLHARPGVWCAGEMLDWEAPTGGYLLTACMATGRAAGEGAWRYLQGR